jgi:hypothetical protein
MKSAAAIVSLALLGGVVICAQTLSSNRKKSANPQSKNSSVSRPASSAQVNEAVAKGAKWLASVQGADGGWGQDGGAASNSSQNQSYESTGNDVANTAVAALALLRAGDQYRPNVERAVNFILKKIEASPADGLSITDVNQTQIQRKLGPYIDTFLASMLLSQADRSLAGANKTRARRGLEKCVAKIERNQSNDGSWNVGGGWAPVLGTSLASRSLFEAKKNGVRVDDKVLAKADTYTVNSQKDGVSYGTGAAGVAGGRPGGAIDRVTPSMRPSAAMSASAGVELYKDAQALEQLSRTAADRAKNATQISAINKKLSDASFVEGYGSIGGEEFFSYLNISDGLKRSGGKEWTSWNSKIQDKILKIQNNDGTWAGHHCITGRVAVTAAAILNLTPEYDM